MRIKKAQLAYFSLGVTMLMLIFSFTLPETSPQMMEGTADGMLRKKPKFIKENFTLTIEGSTANPLASQVEWLEDLSWKDPPLCNSSDPFILAMVISAVHNFEERARVRNTWANPQYYQNTGIKAVFIVGSPGDNETLQTALEEEIDYHEDVIQGDFIDTYRNLTRKTVAWLSWAKNFCPFAPFIAKIDDDVMVNPFNLRLYLQQHLAANGPSPKNIHGRARFKPKPMRYSKWQVTEEEYPGDKYPPIVLGSAYVVDSNAVDILLAYVPYAPFIWLEDVFLTGMVGDKAGIKLKQAERKLYSRKLSRRLFYGTSAFLIDPKPNDWGKGWEGILKHSNTVIKKIKGFKR